MSNVDATASPIRDLWSRLTNSSGPTPPATPLSSPASSAVRPEINYDAAIDNLPIPALPTAMVMARMDPIGAKLDQVKAAASGPYTVNGTTVYSGIQFRMTGGHNQPAAQDGTITETLRRVASRAGLSLSVDAMQRGQADIRSLVRVTQALIDDGQLGVGSKKSLPDQIHDLQWRFAIGLDCAGYVYQAVTAIHGDPSKLGLGAPGYENFTGLPQNPRFARVEHPEDAHTGDVLVLLGRGGGDPGHNLILRSHATLQPPGESITKRWVGADAFVNPPHPVAGAKIHVFEVDSSFSADLTGKPYGGVRRDVILWNDKTDEWCTCKSTAPPQSVICDTPYNEKEVTGFFRAKVRP